MADKQFEELGKYGAAFSILVKACDDLVAKYATSVIGDVEIKAGEDGKPIVDVDIFEKKLETIYSITEKQRVLLELCHDTYEIMAKRDAGGESDEGGNETSNEKGE